MHNLISDSTHVKDVQVDIRLGDCLEILSKFPDNSFDLIATSPPYADSRAKTYGGIKPNDYVEWFLPRAKEFLRVLKPTGTFILNIKEKAINGERHTYVMELILEMRKQGWLWTEEFVWHKKNCFPDKWSNRFRDAWERCLQFNKSRNFNMYQDAVKVPMGKWAESRLRNLSETDQIRDESKVGSGFGKNVSNWVGRDTVYPTNVLHMSTECANKSHSAAFPKALPEWFIKLFTQEGDLVLDPFLGSGTTCQIAQELRRNSVGIEVSPEYYEHALANVKSVQFSFLEKVLNMRSIAQQDIVDYVEQNIHTFHEARLSCLQKLKLEKVLKRKNPYLFKAKNIDAGSLVKTTVDAFLSSSEEGIFGNFLEGLAVFVCSQTLGAENRLLKELT